MRIIRLGTAAWVLAAAPAAGQTPAKPPAQPSAQGCIVPRANFLLGGDMQGAMMARSGQACGGRIFLGTGRDAEGPNQMDSFTVSTPPRNGTVTLRGLNWEYQSRPGFKGSDSFVLTMVVGPMFGTKMTTTFANTVDVQ